MSTQPDLTREERPSIVGSDQGPESPYPIKMFGVVERGFGRGSKELGIPTANLPRSSIAPLEQLSSTGIYFGFAKLHPTASSSSTSSAPTQPSTSSSSRPSDNLSVDTISHLPGKTASYPQAQVDGVDNDKPQENTPDHPSLREEDYNVWPMVMSVGYNPYYGNKEMTAEVHIMHDFPTSFYGHPLSVILLGYIRPELNYVSKEKLIEDINTDVRVALKSLARDEWARFADVKGLGMEGDVVKEVAEQVEGLSVAEEKKKPEEEETKKPKEEEISIKLEFGGGLHLLFSSTPKHTAKLPKTVPETSSPVDVRYLIKWMKENILSERVEMFGDGEGVRPGILVLVNDTDWELEGEMDYQLQAGDEVVFISTLHGG